MLPMAVVAAGQAAALRLQVVERILIAPNCQGQ